MGCHALLQGDLPNPGVEPRSPTLQADSLLSEAPGKPKITGVGSLSLLQRIFLTQESNQGLPHCRWIPYQLSYQGSPSNNLTYMDCVNMSGKRKATTLMVPLQIVGGLIGYGQHSQTEWLGRA